MHILTMFFVQVWNKKCHRLLLATSSECVYVGFKLFSWICLKQLFLLDLLYVATSPGSASSSNFSGHILTTYYIYRRVVSWRLQMSICRYNKFINSCWVIHILYIHICPNFGCTYYIYICPNFGCTYYI